jgi:DNA-binding MarR family transcriptional regulator
LLAVERCVKTLRVVTSEEQSLASDHHLQLELARIQADLDRIRQQISHTRQAASVENDSNALLVGLAKEILRCRRRREKIFGAELFGEPAWDILLELYVAQTTKQKLCVSSACYASLAPTTTALRWIIKLENDQWIERTPDPHDGRRTWLVLTCRGQTAIRRYLKEASIRPI